MNRLIAPLLVLLITSCQSDLPEAPNHENVNSFKMSLNDEAWAPSIIDECEKTFNCNVSFLNSHPFYKIEAFKDPQSIASLSSENLFQIQVMDADHIGIYNIDGTFEGLKTYARFRINTGGGVKIYQNEEHGNSFRVEITEFFPRANTELLGIKGSFGGTLYNIEDKLDSVQIKNGEFVFQKTNWNNFNQCPE